MLVMIDKRNPNKKFEDKSLDKLLDKASEEERSQRLFYFRKRIGYNEYLVQIWKGHPVNQKARAKMVWEIYGVKRKDLTEMKKEFPRPEPKRPIIKDGRPVGDPDLPAQLSILRGS